jgi:aspergillopepsin I
MLSSIISIVALGATIARAAPVADPAAGFVGNSRFSVPAVHNPNYVRNGTKALLKAYAKYNIKPTREVPDAFTEALARRQDGSVTAVPNDGSEYLVPVTIGGEPLNLDFDTGSSDL